MFEQVFNVLKASQNKDLGHQWIDYILSAETQEKWMRQYYWSPVNKNVEVPDDLKDLVPIHGEKMDQIVLWDWKAANAGSRSGDRSLEQGDAMRLSSRFRG